MNDREFRRASEAVEFYEQVVEGWKETHATLVKQYNEKVQEVERLSDENKRLRRLANVDTRGV